MTAPHPRTSFDAIPFRISRSDRERGEVLDWVIPPVVRETHIPGTNRTYIEHLGFEPARVTWTLRFACLADYHALLARLMTTGTLTVPAGIQSLKGTQATYDNRVYEQLDGTLLRALDDTPHYVGGIVEANATFMRAVDPVTREAVVE